MFMPLLVIFFECWYASQDKYLKAGIICCRLNIGSINFAISMLVDVYLRSSLVQYLMSYPVIVFLISEQ